MKAMLAAGLALALAGCAVTEQADPDTLDVSSASGFLSDYGQLKPGKKGQALLVYINPNVDWSRYTKVLIRPVTVGLGPADNLSEQDQQMLASYYYHALETSLGKNFTLVSQPGPGVMTVRAALTDATAATPALRTISVIVPQARLLSSVKNMATGSYAFVGSAQSEGEILDSLTGERLAAAVDRRLGGLSIKNANVWQWGDAEKAMDFWAERMDQRLVQFARSTPDDFAFRNVTPTRGTAGGGPALLVTGQVVNVSDVSRRVPELRLTLLDDDDRDLQSWSVTVFAAPLQPGAAAPFQTSIAQPSRAATKLRLSVGNGGI